LNIVHVPSGKVLADRAESASNPWQRFRGLMLRSPLEAGQGLVIQPCNSIHMMFMRFAIDAVFYNKDMTVTKVSRSVRPWIGLSAGGRKAKGVIELPAGAAEGVEAGDQLLFER
jgi:uncharacterized protein